MVHFEGKPQTSIKPVEKPVSRSPQEIMQQRAANNIAMIAEFRRAQAAIAKGEVKSVEEFYAKQDTEATANAVEHAAVTLEEGSTRPQMGPRLVPRLRGGSPEHRYSSTESTENESELVKEAQDKRLESPERNAEVSAARQNELRRVAEIKNKLLDLPLDSDASWRRDQEARTAAGKAAAQRASEFNNDDWRATR